MFQTKRGPFSVIHTPPPTPPPCLEISTSSHCSHLFVLPLTVGLFITILSKHGTRLDLLFGQIFSCDSMFEFACSACSVSECVFVCVTAWRHTHKQYGLHSGVVEAVKHHHRQIAFLGASGKDRQGTVQWPPNPSWLYGGSWPWVTNSITRSGVIIINTL